MQNWFLWNFLNIRLVFHSFSFADKQRQKPDLQLYVLCNYMFDSKLHLNSNTAWKKSRLKRPALGSSLPSAARTWRCLSGIKSPSFCLLSLHPSDFKPDSQPQSTSQCRAGTHCVRVSLLHLPRWVNQPTEGGGGGYAVNPELWLATVFTCGLSQARLCGCRWTFLSQSDIWMVLGGKCTTFMDSDAVLFKCWRPEHELMALLSARVLDVSEMKETFDAWTQKALKWTTLVLFVENNSTELCLFYSSVRVD